MADTTVGDGHARQLPARGCWQALSPHREDLAIMRGLQLRQSTHSESTACFLTGDVPANDAAEHATIDQVIARRNPPSVALPSGEILRSLQAGVGVRGNGGQGDADLRSQRRTNRARERPSRALRPHLRRRVNRRRRRRGRPIPSLVWTSSNRFWTSAEPSCRLSPRTLERRTESASSFIPMPFAPSNRTSATCEAVQGRRRNAQSRTAMPAVAYSTATTSEG